VHQNLVRSRTILFLVSLFITVNAGEWPQFASAQQTISEVPDSPSSENRGLPPSARDVSWRTLPKNFVEDQKAIWLFPVELAKGKHWVPAVSISAGTAGLLIADPKIMPYFRSASSRTIDTINDVFGTGTTTAEVVALPVSLLIAGYKRHDSYQVGTALLAGEAYADSAVVDLVIKAVTRRKRPADVPVGGDFHNTFFSGGKSPFKGSAFPSGHAAGVFSVATVVATRYRHRRWVPWLMYGFATAVSFSRVTTSAHFPSDVFLGAALGYTITRFQVLRPRSVDDH
jgi:membrane-associated phospholipid phosphatase